MAYDGAPIPESRPLTQQIGPGKKGQLSAGCPLGFLTRAGDRLYGISMADYMG